MKSIWLLVLTLLLAACSVFEAEVPDRDIITSLPTEQQLLPPPEVLAFSHQLEGFSALLKDGHSGSNAIVNLAHGLNEWQNLDLIVPIFSELFECFKPVAVEYFTDVLLSMSGMGDPYFSHQLCNANFEFRRLGPSDSRIYLTVSNQLFLELQLPTIQQIRFSDVEALPFVLRSFRITADDLFDLEAMDLNARFELRNLFLSEWVNNSDLALSEEIFLDLNWRQLVWQFDFSDAGSIRYQSYQDAEFWAQITPGYLLIDNKVFNNQPNFSGSIQPDDCEADYSYVCFKQAYAQDPGAHNVVYASFEWSSSVFAQTNSGIKEVRAVQLAPADLNDQAALVISLKQDQERSLAWADWLLDGRLKFGSNKGQQVGLAEISIQLDSNEMLLSFKQDSLALGSTGRDHDIYLLSRPLSTLPDQLRQDPFQPIADLYFDNSWQGQLEVSGNLVLGSQRLEKVRLLSVFDLDRYQKLFFSAE